MAYSDDVAYCAGLFEGEGSFGVTRTYTKRSGVKALRKAPYVILQIQMTDLEPLQKFVTVFGGYINGPYTPGGYLPGGRKASKPKPFYKAIIQKRENVYGAVNLMWKYLSPRRKEQWRCGSSLL